MQHCCPNVRQSLNMDIDKVQAEVQKRFDDGVSFLKSVPAELRTNKLWQLTADDFAKNVSIGTVAGIALSLIFFSKMVFLPF